jgi:hypothetical protein
VYHEDGFGALAQPLADRTANPEAPRGLADDDQVPVAPVGLTTQSRGRVAPGHELRHGDLGRHQIGGGLHAALRPPHHLVAELTPAGGWHDGAGGDDERRMRRAAEQPETTVSVRRKLDGPLERAPGGRGVRNSDEYPVEHAAHHARF